MTELDKMRDRVAGLLGWKSIRLRGKDAPSWYRGSDDWTNAPDFLSVGHPVKGLDWVVSNWPKGWTWTRDYATHPDTPECGLVMMWRVFHDTHGEVLISDTGNVLHDLMCLLIKALEAEKEA